MNSHQRRDLQSARREAEDIFRELPVRFILHRGVVVSENVNVHVTGAWPTQWTVVRVQDLGVLCAYLFECATRAGLEEAARQFRGQICLASPTTEQLLVYLQALELAEASLAPTLEAEAREALETGLDAARRMLRV